jgi:hypothetical protein
MTTRFSLASCNHWMSRLLIPLSPPTVAAANKRAMIGPPVAKADEAFG